MSRRALPKGEGCGDGGVDVAFYVLSPLYTAFYTSTAHVLFVTHAVGYVYMY